MFLNILSQNALVITKPLVRLPEAAGTLLWLPELEPMLENIGTTQLYLDLALECFKERLVSKESTPHAKACMRLRKCRSVMGDEVFLNKFMPKLVKVFLKRFVEDYFQNSLQT